jgi:hypothetical protein
MSENKIDLKNTTLVCIDDRDTKISGEVMAALCGTYHFGDVKLFSSNVDNRYVSDPIWPITSIKDYNLFVINELYKYINTEFVMFVQSDGYPINESAWTDDFLKYDYIGAPWTWAPVNIRKEHCPEGKCVGNGGFSIRSLKLLKATAEYNYESLEEQGDEDIFTCRTIGDSLKENGMKFAPVELAHYFSVENKIYAGQFGFHGKETLRINKKVGIFKFKDHAYEQLVEAAKNLD